MHDCPSCGDVCDCDGEDHFQQAPATCFHECLPHDHPETEEPDDDGDHERNNDYGY